MNHLEPFCARDSYYLPIENSNGWQLKRYAIVSTGKEFDGKICSAAFDSAIERLPEPGELYDEDGNHGVGFQIIHFAEIAVVSPVFYWQWGSVLASIDQMRAPWNHPTRFTTGAKEVVGCIWEMQIVSFETQAWMNTVLKDDAVPAERLKNYIEQNLPTAEPIV